MSHLVAFFAAVTVLLAAGCGLVPVASPGLPAAPGRIALPADAEGPFRMLRVVDGDTVSIEKDGMKVKVRLVELDTPETKDPRKTVQ